MHSYFYSQPAIPVIVCESSAGRISDALTAETATHDTQLQLCRRHSNGIQERAALCARHRGTLVSDEEKLTPDSNEYLGSGFGIFSTRAIILTRAGAFTRTE